MKTTSFNAADHLDTDEAQRWFVIDALESKEFVPDPAHIARTIDLVAEVRGLPTLGARGPATIETLMSVLDAIGLKLAVSPTS